MSEIANEPSSSDDFVLNYLRDTRRMCICSVS